MVVKIIWSTVYIDPKGSQVIISNNVFLSLKVKINSVLVNSVDSMKCRIMWHFIWVFTVCQSTCLKVSSAQKVNLGTAFLNAATFLNAEHKAGLSKPPLVLTSGFNRLKPSWSICQKVVNTGQYESVWSIEIFNWPFWWWIEILGQVLGCIYRKKKKKLFPPCQGHFFTIALTSALQSGVQAPNHQGQNRITIQPYRVFFSLF